MEIIPPISHTSPWRTHGQFASCHYVNITGDIPLATGPSFYFDSSGEMQNNAARNSIGARSKALPKSQPVNRRGVHYARQLSLWLAAARGDT